MIFDLTRWPEADRLLDEALALPPHEQTPYLDRVAGHDPQLRAALAAVLAEAADDDGFLDPGGALTGALGDDISRTLTGPPPTGSVLTIGNRIDRYEVKSLLGRGGMGEVYRARDPRLRRDVALKVLPYAFAADAERVARFTREARVLASLSHPGIAAIYGMVEEEGLKALVLEFVQGMTLAERLASGPLPVPEALALARQLAEAVEAAHDAGVVHRDLKPANVMVTGGELKVLDFGLAKAIAPAPGDHRITALIPGIMLGTAPYMSPEQARGQPADARSDVWAFGCVLFEMLTGTRAFPGTAAPDVLGRVLNRDPAFDQLPPDTPTAARRLVRRALQKDPRHRLRCMHDARLEVEEAFLEVAARDTTVVGAAARADAPPAVPAAAEPAADRQGSRAVGWLTAAALAVVALTLAGFWMLTPRAPVGVSEASRAVTRFEIALPGSQLVTAGIEPVAALSADGQTLVYSAREAGVSRLYRRDMNSAQPHPIAGTEGGTAPLVSPDGQWVAFVANGMLRRVPAAGGTPVDLVPAPGAVTGAWLDGDEIAFSSTGSRALAVVTLPGGALAPLTTLDPSRGDTWHLLPQPLPGGRTLLFTLARGPVQQIAVLDRDTGATRIVADGSHARYVRGGYLVFSRDGSLWASRFDAASLTLEGMPMRLDEAMARTADQVVHFDVASDGSLVFLPEGSAAPVPQPLTWIDRTGRSERARVDPNSYVGVSTSPNGTRLALAIREQAGSDIWIADPTRGTMTQLTAGPAGDTDPVWTPDGGAVTFQSDAAGRELFMRDAQGARPAVQLTHTGGTVRGRHATTRAGTIIFSTGNAILERTAAGETRTLFESPSQLLNPQPSADGRWLAYESDESGRLDVYVRALAPPAAAQRVSSGGGSSPRWSDDGRELFYLGAEGLMSVPVRRTGPDLPAATRLFTFAALDSRPVDFDLARDGERFVFILEGARPADARQSLVVVRNWSDQLGALLTRSPAAPVATP